MSNLWVHAMAWHQEPGDSVKHDAIPVKHAGFAGYVDDSERRAELEEGQDHDEGGFDEDLHDEVSPEPTHEEERHMEEHGYYPDSYDERHDQAYNHALQKRKDEDTPDIEDPGLIHFIGQHGSDRALWQNKGSLGMVSLKDKPVYATQTHVSKQHVERYLHNPHDLTAHQMQYGRGAVDHLANDAPVFVTHEGRLHTIEGHHRIAAAMQAGQDKIHAWHFNLDKHPQYEHLNEGEDE
jgi:hypothetical protein